MSEVRTTTSVELVREPRREAFTCLAEAVSNGVTLVAHASSTAAKTAASGMRAVMNNAKVAQNHSLTLSSMTAIVGGSQTAQEALITLAASGEVAIPRADAPAFVAKLEGIVTRNDKAGLEREVRGMIVARQNRLHSTMVSMVAEACQAVGYRAERIEASSGLVVVRGEGNEEGRIDIARDKDGGIKLHFDTDGFEKDECTTKLVEPVIRHLKSQGAQMGTQYRRPKNRNAYDRARMGSRAICRRR